MGYFSNTFVIKPDDINERITDLEETVFRWLSNYQSDAYITKLLTDERHSLIVKVGAEVQSFIEGNYNA